MTKWMISAALLALMAGSGCGQTTDGSTDSDGSTATAAVIDPLAVAVTAEEIKAKLDAGHFIFKSDAPAGGWPNGEPATLRAAKDKQWKHQKKTDRGLQYFEVAFVEDMLLLKAEPMLMEWDTFFYKLKGDTMYQYKVARNGIRTETPDFMVIERVGPTSLDIADYSRDNPSSRYELDFKLQAATAPVLDLEAVMAARKEKAERTKNSTEQLKSQGK